MKFIFNLLLILFGFTLLNAQQTSTIKGIVLDFHDKVPLAGTTVTLGTATTKTDASGNFTFTSLTNGTYTLIANHPDCNIFSEKIVVNKDSFFELNLEHHVSDIENVTIHGTHKNKNTLIIKTLDHKDLERNATDNLGNLLTGISGVGVLKSGNNIAKPVIHGLYGSRISIINNGVKMAEQEWGVEHAPNIDANQFGHIDVLKGASALKYGSDAIGGVVLLIPETYKKIDTLQGSANVAGILNGKGIAVDLNLVKTWSTNWALKTQGGYKKLGDLETPNYLLMNSGLEFNSFNFSLQNTSFLQGISFDYSLTNQEVGIFRGSHIGNLDDFYTALNSNVPLYQRDFSYDIDNPKQLVQHHLAKISAYKRLKGIGKFSLDYSLQYNHREEFDIRRGELNDVPSLDLELYTNQLKINNLLERKNWKWETGIDLAYQYNYSSTETKARRLVPNYTKYSGGAYSFFQYRINPILNIEGALRYDYSHFDVKKWFDESDWFDNYDAEFSQFYVKTDGNRVFTNPILKYNNLSFSTGLQWNPAATVDVKLNYAKVSRTPNIAELFSDGLHHSAAVLERGDFRLKNESGNQFSASVESKISQALEISVNPYLFLTQNFINQIPTGIQNTIRGVFPVWTYEQINVRMYGLDADVNLNINSDFTYKGRFSYVNGKDLTNDQPLILMLPTNFTNSLELEKKAWNNFYFKVENQTVLRQKNFPLFNPTIEIFENGVEVEKTLDLSTPPPSYSLWNIQTGIDFNKNFSAGLNITNLFDTEYRDYLNRMRFFSAEMGRNVIFNVKYKF